MAGYVVAIPSRFASTRLPGKPLAKIGDEPMIHMVCRQALKSAAERVIACVDDERVAAALQDLDVTVCMTSASCKCGTDRIAEMVSREQLPNATVIVNVQGDEPMINPEHIDQVARLLQTSGCDMATLCFPIRFLPDVFDPNCVKVVFDTHQRALYFSRCPIPFERGNFPDGGGQAARVKFPHYHHMGIYAYKAGTVTRYATMPQGELERCECLEQLRLMAAGMSIAVAVTNNPPETGVDTPADLARINARLRKERR